MQVLALTLALGFTALYGPIQFHQFATHENALLTASADVATRMREAARERALYAHCHDHSEAMRQNQESIVAQQRAAIAAARHHLADLQNENLAQVLLDPVI
jgi:ABC-type uncharacterized transport system YnjBCD ATPase subunit